MKPVISLMALLFSLFFCHAVMAEKGSIPGNSPRAFGKTVSNMIGVTYATKVIYAEMLSRCEQWAPDKQPDLENAWEQWEKRNHAALESAEKLLNVTLELLDKAINNPSKTKQQQTMAEQLNREFSTMIPKLKEDAKNRLDRASPKDGPLYCEQAAVTLNSKKADAKTRDQALHQLLLDWDEKVYRRDFAERILG